MGFKIGNVEIIDASGNITATVGDIDGRDISVDGAKLDGIEAGATADQTASEILTAIKTVDGTTSGLDADLLDGQEGSYYLDGNNFINLPAGYANSDVDTHLNTGTAASSQFLSWNGTDYAWATPTDTNTTYSAGTNLSLSGTTFNVASSPTFTTVTATDFNTTSDARLKTNVETLTGSLDKVKGLRGVSFDWKATHVPDIGFLAQEVEEVLPELVNIDDAGTLSVKYSNIVAVLVEAIKEQQAQIDELKEKVGA